MRSHVAAVIEAVSYPGWRVEVVGGQARGEAHHDAGKLLAGVANLCRQGQRRLAGYVG